MNTILKYVAKVFVTVVKLASPDLVAEMRDWAVKFRKKCETTTNPWDDVLAEAICQILGV